MKNVPSTYVHFGVDNSETGQRVDNNACTKMVDR